MRIGIFGGTFNPPHVGHLIVAEHVRERLDLDKVIFVPSATSPHKQHLESLSAHHRAAMLRCAIEGNRYFEISELEIQRGGVSFTIDTLTALKDIFKRDELYLLIGKDNLAEFHTWKKPERILELARVVVMSRPGMTSSLSDIGSGAGLQECTVPEIGISSTEVRTRIKEGQSVRYLVTEAVEAYIHTHQLYL